MCVHTSSKPWNSSGAKISGTHTKTQDTRTAMMDISIRSHEGMRTRTLKACNHVRMHSKRLNSCANNRPLHQNEHHTKANWLSCCSRTRAAISSHHACLMQGTRHDGDHKAYAAWGRIQSHPNLRDRRCHSAKNPTRCLQPTASSARRMLPCYRTQKDKLKAGSLTQTSFLSLCKHL